MIIGFGFGPPLVSLLMLIVTAGLSYGLYRLFSRRAWARDPERRREQLRRYYHEQRQLARRLSREFDLTDEEIEKRIEDEINRRS
ncbi:hypothetical protein [Alicyclobacillus kakegawensis]|uniref:hypothetical protein n=1 Tax=Alicyclobacillus kakegawensis TaxID=392012 RepID=UPI000833F3B1|nr:hypothetical protein [Alicyclobacillus kakegawensis]